MKDILDKINKKPKKVLDEETAQKYLDKAKGDVAKARAMAIADGYEIPEHNPKPMPVMDEPDNTPEESMPDPGHMQGMMDLAESIKMLATKNNRRWEFDFKMKRGMIVGMTAREVTGEPEPEGEEEDGGN